MGFRRYSKEQRRSAAEEAATACSDVRSTAEQQQGSTHSVRGTEGEGILEMSELWLPQWHCPSYSGRGGRKRRVFFTWDCGWLMAINSISHLSSLPPLLGSREVQLVGAALLLTMLVASSRGCVGRQGVR